MKSPLPPIPQTPEMEAVAHRIIWFEPPASALADPIRFLAYAMRHATWEDLMILWRHIPESAFAEALTQAPPGIIDARSWSYWHVRLFGQSPPPPMPTRSCVGTEEMCEDEMV
ncbi:MAG: hypothetical protein H7834_08215 [Magnetococcus sp. YQC-9]